MIIRPDSIKEFFSTEGCFIREIINQPATPGLSLAEARVSAGNATEPHILTVDEYYVILEGKGIVYLDGQEAGQVERGDYVVIRAGTTQSIQNPGPGELRILCVCNPRFQQDLYTAVGG